MEGVVEISYHVAAGDDSGKVQERVTAPPVPEADAADVVLAVARYGRFVPTSVAVKEVTLSGCKKLSCAEDLIPLPLIAIFVTPFLILYQVLC